MFNIISGICSILSFLISLFVASKVINISNSINVKGNKNITTGGDINVNGRH